ncbi:MAG: hypothetical protein ACLU4N_07030 [Butyricimonas faecihominis]
MDGDKTTEYMSVPFNVIFSQPLITANPEMEYEDRAGKVQASSAAVCREHENVAVQAISYYFDLLLAMINVI